MNEQIQELWRYVRTYSRDQKHPILTLTIFLLSLIILIFLILIPILIIFQRKLIPYYSKITIEEFTTTVIAIMISIIAVISLYIWITTIVKFSLKKVEKKKIKRSKIIKFWIIDSQRSTNQIVHEIMNYYNINNKLFNIESVSILEKEREIIELIIQKVGADKKNQDILNHWIEILETSYESNSSPFILTISNFVNNQTFKNIFKIFLTLILGSELLKLSDVRMMNMSSTNILSTIQIIEIFFIILFFMTLFILFSYREKNTKQYLLNILKRASDEKGNN